MSYGLLDSIKIENGKTYFSSERLLDIVNDCDWESSNLTEEEYREVKDAKVIEKIIQSTSRWSVYYKVIFKLDERHYETTYSRGSTEMQDEHPYQDDGEWVEVTEVEPTEVVTIMYVPKGRV